MPAAAIFAQPSKKEREVLANTRLLERTVFQSKDSVTLEKLFGNPLSYVHSSGKAENREQAVHGIVNNKSTYTWANVAEPYNVRFDQDSAIVVHVFRATERKADGTESALNLSIEYVWIKVKKDWKLVRRKATKVQS